MTTSSTTIPWLTIYKPNPRAKLRLFCFPYAGGAASIYRNWADGISTIVEVCPVQLAGREHRLRERAFTSVDQLVPAATQALLPYFDKPFAFYGHSMGAIIGFELARHLRRENLPQPERLFVSGRSAPQLTGVDPLTYNLPDPEFIERLRALNGTPKEVLEHPELMELMMPMLRADFELVQTYSYSPESKLNLPISVFGGLEDFHVPQDHLKAWKEQTNSPIALRMFPGDHFFLHTSVAQLLQKLSEELHETSTV